VGELDRPPSVRVLAVSRLYRSPPLGGADQPDYYNAVVALETALEPGRLLAWLHAIEYLHGRRRDGRRWAPRPLDLDLLLWSDRVSAPPDPVLPHPGLASRAFVLYPLRDVAPGLDVPGLGPVDALCARLPPHALVVLDDWPR
jgi:2-amino-4-hydroxy-6-hydroxymethyldihydropteridine diphosphokinase